MFVSYLPFPYISNKSFYLSSRTRLSEGLTDHAFRKRGAPRTQVKRERCCSHLLHLGGKFLRPPPLQLQTPSSLPSDFHRVLVLFFPVACRGSGPPFSESRSRWCPARGPESRATHLPARPCSRRCILQHDIRKALHF